MNGTQLSVLFLVPSILIGLYFGAEVVNTFAFPELEIPEIEFIDVSSGCSSFSDCTEYLANIIYNIGAGAIFAAVFAVNLIVFIAALFVFFVNAVELVASTLSDAPWYITGPVGTVLTVIAGTWIYRTATGNSED